LRLIAANSAYGGPNPGGIYTDPVGHWVVMVVAMLVVLFVLVTVTAYVVFLERVLIGRFQRRPGPNRVGPYGFLQSAVDGVKLLTKESFMPTGVDRFTYLLAPAIAVLAALLTWSVVPFAIWSGYTYWISNVNIGILVVFAISAMNVYAIMLGGYSSNNKYSLLGGLRSAAQLISYEMALGLSLVPTFIIVGSLRLSDIANYSVKWGPYHGVIPLIILTPIGFVLYLVAAVAETNRAPFDLPEAEQELVGGFHTEYSGFKFAMFYLAEYMNIFAVSAIASVLFLGGGAGPILPGIVWFAIKILIFLCFYIWIRSTLPRLRYDSLMQLGWKVMLPLAILNVIVTALIVVWVG
jgi:NADH-quinone oxidoreductase subunit H